MEILRWTSFDTLKEEVTTYFKSSLADFYGIAANRMLIYAVAFILMGLSVFAVLSIYDYTNLLITIPLKFMGMNAWHTAANLVLCTILVDVLFAFAARPWGAYARRTVGKVWIIFFVGFLLGFLSERTLAYKLIGLYEPFVIFLWQANPTERAGALPMFFLVLPFWLVITSLLIGIMIRKQIQTEEYLRVRIDAALQERSRRETIEPDAAPRDASPVTNASGTPLQLPTDPGVGPIFASDIGHMTSEDHYLRIYFEKEAKQQNTLVRMTLKELFARLPEEHFVQIHRSHLVNLEKISRLNRSGQAVRLSMAYGDFELPVSRYRLPQILPIIEKFLG